MVNILLDYCNIDHPWLYDELKNYIQSHHKVVVVAFSKAESVAEWELLYGKKNGKHYDKIVGGFTVYGIPEENVAFVNYFADTKDTALNKIKDADIVYFPGGMPDRMMERIQEFELQDAIMAHKGVVMGYSAGALIQLAEYHISPDEDYPEFQYCEGLPFLKDFYLEVHYDENATEQNLAIKKVLEERRKTVYATSFSQGAILVDNGTVKLLGDVKVYK